MSNSSRGIECRHYGEAGPWVVAVHGGPGAPGHMAPIARRLAARYRVLEPLQRRSGAESLSVAVHVSDMESAIRANCGSTRPAVVGSSWGAMLALCHAAANPHSTGPLVLVGCGTFDLDARAEFKRRLAERLAGGLQAEIDQLDSSVDDPDARLAAKARLIGRAYEGELSEPDQDTLWVDARGNREAWDDMLKLQSEGTIPSAFRAIRSPVLMIHGDADPHPGRMIRDSLLPYLPQLEYHEIPGCGHDPWREPSHREGFFRAIEDWLGSRFGYGTK